MWHWVSGQPQKTHRERASRACCGDPLAKLWEWAIQSNRCFVRRPRWRGVGFLMHVRADISEGQYRVHREGELE